MSGRCGWFRGHHWGRWTDLWPTRINGWLVLVQTRQCEVCGKAQTRTVGP